MQIRLQIALVVLLLVSTACGSTGEVSPQTLTAEPGAPESAALPAGIGKPSALPPDGIQPWESLTAGGHVLPADARASSSINASTDFTPGVERFMEAGDFADNGEALRLNGSDDSGSSYAMYRVSLQAEQPGIVSIDANLLGSGSEYYVGLSNYGAGRWDWRGPFTDGRIRLPVVHDGSGEYTSTLGNTFVTVLVDSGSALDIVGVEVNQFDLADTTAPTTPLGLSLTPVNGGLELNWSPVLEADLAGYAIYYSNKSFVNPISAGVRTVPYLEGSTQHLLSGLKTASFVAVAAVDFAGNASALSSLASATPLAAEPGSLSLTGSAASGGINESITLSAGGADLYDWDLNGDGIFEIANDSSGSQLADTSATGLFRPHVRGHDVGGEAVALGGLSLIITGNTRPVASAVANPQSGPAPLDVDFSGTADDAEDEASELSYAWDFDGNGVYEPGTDTLTPATQSYTTAGSYNIKFRATDSGGAWDLDTLSVFAAAPGNVPPAGELAASPASGDTPLTVDFDASASSDSDGSITQYMWDFDGDGGIDRTTLGGMTSWTYTEGGAFQTRVHVLDDGGALGVSGPELIQVNATPDAQLSVDRPSAGKGESFSFDMSTSTDSDGTIDIIDWDFDGDGIFAETGDEGNASGMMQVNMTWDSPGERAVSVHLVDNDGAIDEASATVTVQGWVVVQVDDTVFSAEWPSLAEVSGRPAISYFDDSGLAYALSSSADGADAADWSIVSIEDAGQLWATDLAVLTGRPSIAYVHSSDNTLHFARSSTASGASAGDWTITELYDILPLASQVQVDLALVGGNPAIASYAQFISDSELAYSRSSTPEGESPGNWSTLLVDANSVGSLGVSMQVVDGNPAITYAMDNKLTYVRSSTALGMVQADWNNKVTALAQSPMLYSAMVVSAGSPRIASYYGAGGINDLYFVHSSTAGGNASADWSTFALDSPGVVGSALDMALIGGRPAVSYRDATNNRLKLARSTTQGGSSLEVWEHSVVDDSTNPDVSGTSIAEINGRLAIAYAEFDNKTVRYAILF